ncbi:glycine/D-amino acid oxidase-like deaminating enzyme [Saccharopolyspora erythraea NRRL 2338]|uniref:Fructosyl-amino acid oxidase, putative n=2 Tax=Saccharopolyspora erythraea TaxID=1836 RepID=A4FDW4_SACEN|nr:FAD-dependent oxidoreductase [Saccharopolyspora erythraea]EQD82251.1 fructosyl-amino acid oxidase [Saccharopolyspora erythraea D]PFG95969.1 glycine/D-amino acid oxidase-like deaminating enzyme [Saccharopolyspora erythraea NRRL 2338]QRK92533.1 FAD-binding oxidoreductase [Saccharopolyspora erythraea]CAM02239.1 fructosyl-amino acid oxidase, putative [Saccharopolyspora erythraea NRRL 2338]
MKTAVIGLGVLGASAARSLALAGAEVTVLERSAPLAGTSGTSFAWTNSHNKNPRSYHDLNVAGMAEHDALAAAPGPCRPWLARTGNLEWAEEDGAERLAASVAELTDRGYPVEWIGSRRARDLVPDLRVPGTEIAFYPTEGHVVPALLLARLWGEARDRGARLRCPAEVTGLSEVDGGVRVSLSGDDPAVFDAVVIATGRWTEAVTAAAGHRVAMASPDVAGSATVGLLGYTNPLPARLHRVLTTPALNVRPDGGGRLVVQGLDLDADADPAAPPPVDGEHARELCARLTGLLDGTAGARLESLRVGQRAMPADGLTAAGFLGGSDRIYAMATHSGITLGPLLGRLAAQELTTGQPAEALADFRPDRLLGRTDLPPLRPARFAGQQ